MPDNVIEVLKIFGGAILLIGFFYFILLRAFNTKNYKRKSLYMFISGMIIFLFFVGGIIYDYIKGVDFNNIQIGYFAFPIVALVAMIFFTVYYYVKGRKYKQKLKSNFEKINKQINKPTIKNKKENLYIILKYNNNFLLKKYEENNEFYYRGITVKFPHDEFFHDELVNQFIENNNLDVISFNNVGKATKREKNDIIYYCYKILLNSLPEKIKDLEEIDAYQMFSINLKEKDKKILFTSVVESDFNIDVE